jgi:hypothetical protein
MTLVFLLDRSHYQINRLPPRSFLPRGARQFQTRQRIKSSDVNYCSARTPISYILRRFLCRAARTEDDVADMKVSYARFWRQICVVSGALLVLYFSVSAFDIFRAHGVAKYIATPRWRDSSSLDEFNNLGLTEKQCTIAFPGLTKDIDETVSLGPFKMKTPTEAGPLVASINKGSVSFASVVHDFRLIWPASFIFFNRRRKES